MAALEGLQGVQRLLLDGTGITDEGLKPLRRLAGLEHLNLTGTRVSDRGAADLSQALPKARIIR